MAETERVKYSLAEMLDTGLKMKARASEEESMNSWNFGPKLRCVSMATLKNMLKDAAERAPNEKIRSSEEESTQGSVEGSAEESSTSLETASPSTGLKVEISLADAIQGDTDAGRFDAWREDARHWRPEMQYNWASMAPPMLRAGGAPHSLARGHLWEFQPGAWGAPWAPVAPPMVYGGPQVVSGEPRR